LYESPFYGFQYKPPHPVITQAILVAKELMTSRYNFLVRKESNVIKLVRRFTATVVYKGPMDNNTIN
jgi:hypothetical protein